MSSANFLGQDPLLTAASLENLAHDLRLLAGGTHPDLDGAPRIEDWRLVRREAIAIDGVVQGHPIIIDGRRALSSEVFAFDPDRRWARTLSRFYVLGPQSRSDG